MRLLILLSWFVCVGGVSFLRKEEPAEGSPPEVITDMSQIHSVGTLTQVRVLPRHRRCRPAPALSVRLRWCWWWWWLQVQNTIPLGMGGQVVLVSHRRIKIDGPFAVGPPLRVKVRAPGMAGAVG